jgi:hypothetical protein
VVTSTTSPAAGDMMTAAKVLEVRAEDTFDSYERTQHDELVREDAIEVWRSTNAKMLKIA